jgi:proline iminopeptidase
MNKKTGVIILSTLLFFLLSLFSLLALVPGQQPNPAEGELWPQTSPYETVYLQVSKLHKIFYQLGGNTKGNPVMVLHGGPGGQCSPHDFRYFNPEKYHIILHDQRGAGMSLPFAELKENTTQHLVQDIEKLRQHLKLGSVIIFGGSWGSTLALAYAETYPQNIKGMILRGVFTASKQEIDHYYHGGTEVYFPANYQKLISLLDHPEKKNLPIQLLEKLQSLDPNIRKKYARAWAEYEIKISMLEITDQTINQWLEHWNPYGLALLENYYMANHCFLKEGKLLENIDKLADLPIIIVNGRFDILCPPITAYTLSTKLSACKLIIVEKAGHSSGEALIRHQLVLAAKEFESL